MEEGGCEAGSGSGEGEDGGEDGGEGGWGGAGCPVSGNSSEADFPLHAAPTGAHAGETKRTCTICLVSQPLYIVFSMFQP